MVILHNNNELRDDSQIYTFRYVKLSMYIHIAYSQAFCLGYATISSICTGIYFLVYIFIGMSVNLKRTGISTIFSCLFVPKRFKFISPRLFYIFHFFITPRPQNSTDIQTLLGFPLFIAYYFFSEFIPRHFQLLFLNFSDLFYAHKIISICILFRWINEKILSQKIQI